MDPHRTIRYSQMPAPSNASSSSSASPRTSITKPQPGSCTFPSHTHTLTCGHAVRTDTIIYCGSNCAFPELPAEFSPFTTAPTMLSEHFTRSESPSDNFDPDIVPARINPPMICRNCVVGSVLTRMGVDHAKYLGQTKNPESNPLVWKEVDKEVAKLVEEGWRDASVVKVGEGVL
ncbi:hypothetical protein IQ07DRAFT_637746 [Pyrenochaeta sp. DS3sAY3a]|nr:hypothetical protein IQ07DRAFT_637746 [Pyrenochaeta sp. DS3sAY3a]